ncbi:MAG: hypothetical protein QW480_02420 [Candidatus Aenigmatarchaeota archaeon]
MSGKIVVYTGPMFSGKTTFLLSELEAARISGEIRNRNSYVAIKPIIDRRYSDFRFDEEFGVYVGSIDSHSGNSIKCYGAESFEDIYNLVKRIEERDGKLEIIGIDELNLFKGSPNEALEILEYFSHGRNSRVFCAGLDTNYRGEPFSPIPEIMSIADEVYKRRAVCKICGSLEATRTQRLDLVDVKNGKPIYVPSPYDAETIIVGGGLEENKEKKNFPKHIYEPRCIAHHEVPGKPRRYWSF